MYSMFELTKELIMQPCYMIVLSLNYFRNLVTFIHIHCSLVMYIFIMKNLYEYFSFLHAFY